MSDDNSYDGGWAYLDLEAMLQEREMLPEAVAGVTTSGNAGAYPVPLGGMLRRAPVDGITGIPAEYQEFWKMKSRG